MIDLKTKLAERKTTIGGWLSVSSFEVAEAMASIGLDWIVVDMEHGSFGIHDAEASFLAIERHDCVALVRLPSADPYFARRVLDAGARGVLVPAVEHAQAFREFASHCLFPPVGKRGMSLERFNRWGDDFDRYNAEFQPVLIPQIETRAGVESADAIAAMPEVDAVFIGPYDLSADIGIAGKFEDPRFQKLVGKVQKACKENSKACGIHQVAPDLDALRAQRDAGFSFIAFGTDMIAMRYALSAVKEL